MSHVVVVPAPHFLLDAACSRPGPNGPYEAWRDGYHNVVVNQGKAHILNRLFGGGTASSAGIFMQLHSATTASNHVWSNISGSQVASYGNNLPLLTFNSTVTIASTSQTCSYAFAAGTQTVSGGCIQFYTTNTMSTNAATGDIIHYSEGQFANSRQVINGDSLYVTLTVSYA